MNHLNVVNIGFVDSGFGGIVFANSLFNFSKDSISKALKKGFKINIKFFLDRENVPFGIKNREEVISLGSNLINKAMNSDCSIIFVACNTISIYQKHLKIINKKNLKIYFLIEETANYTYKIKEEEAISKINIWATELTIKNNTYQDLLKKIDKKQNQESNLSIYNFTPKNWVETIESYENREGSIKKIEKDLKDMMVKNKDLFTNSIICLFCTHYEFFTENIKNILSELRIDAILISQGKIFSHKLVSFLNKISEKSREIESAKGNKGRFVFQFEKTQSEEEINKFILDLKKTTSTCIDKIETF